MFDAANVPQTPWLAYSTETKTRATNKHTAVSFGSSMDSVTMCDPQHATGCASFSQQASVSFSPQATGCVSPQVDPNILHVGSLNFLLEPNYPIIFSSIPDSLHGLDGMAQANTGHGAN